MSDKLLDFAVILKAKKSTDWEYIALTCMNNTNINYLKEDQSETVTNCAISSYSNRAGEITSTLYQVLNQKALELFQDAITSVTPEGTTAVDENREVLNDKVIELRQRSSDLLWVTAIVVEPQGGGTAFILDTDYSVATINNVTKITILAGAINIGDTINITWSVELFEQNNNAIWLWAVADIDIDIMLEWGKKVNWVYKSFVLEAKAGSQTSWYIMAFLNKIKPSAPEGSELVFKFTEGDVEIDDQVTPAS